MKNSTKITLIILILIAIISGIIFSTKINLTGQTTQKNPDYYTYTKAICDENNICEDYTVECEGNTKLSLSATGYMIQNPENWTDKREEKDLCEN